MNLAIETCIKDKIKIAEIKIVVIDVKIVSCYKIAAHIHCLFS